MPVKYILFFIVLIFSLQASAQPTWKLKKDKKGVKVYSRKSDKSKFNDIKVEVTFTGTVDQLRSILVDAENYTEWVFSTSLSKRLETISANEFIYYSVFNVPWPASDRDTYSRTKLNMNASMDTLTMFTHAVPDYGAQKKNRVRIASSAASWTATATPSNTIQLVYVLETEPGGELPSWLVNLFFTKGPYNSFRNLKAQMQQNGNH